MDYGNANAEPRADLSSLITLSPISQDFVSGSLFPEDHVEIGYYQRPGGPKTYCALRLPMGAQPAWPLIALVRQDPGVFQLGGDLLGGSRDFGGNIETLPPSDDKRMGHIVVGQGNPSILLRFFLNQQKVQPVIELNTKWLKVGHVDEVFAFTADPNRILLADPNLAYQKMESIQQNDRGKAVFFATGSTPPVSGNASQVATSDRLYTGIDHRNGPAWTYVRIYDDGLAINAANKRAGQVGEILSRENGFLQIGKVWDSSARILDGADNSGACYTRYYMSEHPSQGQSVVRLQVPSVG